MRTGLSKKQKTTSVFFDEASPIIEGVYLQYFPQKPF